MATYASTGDPQQYAMQALAERQRQAQEQQAAQMHNHTHTYQHQQFGQSIRIDNSLSALGAAGSAMGGLTGWSDSTTTTNAGDYNLYVDGSSMTTGTVNIGNETLDEDMIRKLKTAYGTTKEKVIKFFRINKVVEMKEGEEYADPLDELRLKVARWLNPKEKYNFA